MLQKLPRVDRCATSLNDDESDSVEDELLAIGHRYRRFGLFLTTVRLCLLVGGVMKLLPTLSERGDSLARSFTPDSLWPVFDGD